MQAFLSDAFSAAELSSTALVSALVDFGYFVPVVQSEPTTSVICETAVDFFTALVGRFSDLATAWALALRLSVG